MLAPAITKDFSDLLKKLQVIECSTPVAGCVVLQTEYIVYHLDATETYNHYSTRFYKLCHLVKNHSYLYFITSHLIFGHFKN